MNEVLDEGLPPARVEFEPALIRHYLLLAIAAIVLVASGMGLRDPWPADEPRFVSLARDMVVSGDWLFPRVGGDLYQDKPPLFFWLLAGAYSLTGSIRWSFLLPSFFAACGTLVLVYDLVRRLAGRDAAIHASFLLVCSVQFVLAARAAQIDATLCLLTTFSLYALLRHLLFGPSWGWYFTGGLAAGLGVITKGVGFLPLLVLPLYALLRRQGFEPLPQFVGGKRWWLAGVGFLIGVGVWLVPMLVAVASSDDPALRAYRDEILFQQTVDRYASSWHHIKPWYYFLVEVIPPLWLPLSLLIPWLVPRWFHALRARDAFVWLPLGWVLITLLFFSASPGKRGIYLLPALPAFVVAAAPYLEDLFERRVVQWISLFLGALLVLFGAGVLVAYAYGIADVRGVLEEGGIRSLFPIVVLVIAGAAAWIVAWACRPIFAWPATFAVLALVWSYGIAPQMNPVRSSRAFMQSVYAQLPVGAELGMMGYKEQFLLHLQGPIVNFGHRRWVEGQQEAYDAARWLNESKERVLLLPETALEPCFEGARRIGSSTISGEVWLLVAEPAAEECAKRGDPARVIHYKQ